MTSFTKYLAVGLAAAAAGLAAAALAVSLHGWHGRFLTEREY